MKYLMIVLAAVATNVMAQSYNKHNVPDWDDAYAIFDTRRNMTSRSLIVWHTTDDVNKACGDLNKSKGNPVYSFSVTACSYWERSPSGEYSCIIVTGRKTNMHSLGHEVRHCFQDRWHDF